MGEIVAPMLRMLQGVMLSNLELGNARQKFPLASRAHICTVSAQPGGEKGKGEAALLLGEGGAFVLCPSG